MAEVQEKEEDKQPDLIESESLKLDQAFSDKKVIWVTLDTINLPQKKFSRINDPEPNPEREKQENLREIVNSIEVVWNLANIKEVKDIDWNTILECRWKTPYINKAIIEDIIWFAQEFFEKTWTALTLNNAYRSLDYQNKLKKMKWDNAAESWKSWHNLWLSIDMDRTDRYNQINGWLKWMEALAEKHNFSRTIASEDWHFDHKSLTNNPNERLSIAKTIDKNLKSTASA